VKSALMKNSQLVTIEGVYCSQEVTVGNVVIG